MQPIRLAYHKVVDPPWSMDMALAAPKCSLMSEAKSLLLRPQVMSLGPHSSEPSVVTSSRVSAAYG
jgi:hypothetical protein